MSWLESTSGEGEDEEEDGVKSQESRRKRSSSEFSSEKVVIRSPSSTHKTEVVTIAPTDAIEDNALDVPQDIEAAKPRQGKVLNFDEELFVECCSRLKATTENELRGAKKIKLDHTDAYHKNENQQEGLKPGKDRWRDVESQNSLGSLLESVNQLLGEEMYTSREYQKRARNPQSEHSSRSASPENSRAENLGYEDSLDVAFEHNNKLRDKIQQRMRESENLIASTFAQKVSPKQEQPAYGVHQGHPGMPNGEYNELRVLQEQGNKLQLDSPGFKSKMNSALGGLLDKALSNLLHNNEKHDHNGSTPMKVLAELACARAPTSTSTESTVNEKIQPPKSTLTAKHITEEPNVVNVSKELLVQKKTRNPIRELFERKKELNDKKQQERTKTEVALRELNTQKQRKTKKTKKRQDFPLIRRGEHGGLAEKKKRREILERKEEMPVGRIKDVYEFDEEESQTESNLGPVMSYRTKLDKSYEVSCLRTKEVDVAGLMTKAIGDTLENGKTGDALGTRLKSMIDRKFKELEKFAPKTKGALKSFQVEEQPRQITGPMDDFVERKQQRIKRNVDQSLRLPKRKKGCKNLKKKSRHAWYDDDSSDEYVIAVKAEDVGVGITKSQRTCSKGKQNLFALISSSSESEGKDEDADYEARRQRRVRKNTKEVHEEIDQTQTSEKFLDNEQQQDEWQATDLKDDATKNDCDNKKSESEMSDHPLVIDERKDLDEQRNTDDETETQYDRAFELDDLYREDSSVAESDVEEPTVTEARNISEPPKSPTVVEQQKVVEEKSEYNPDEDLIPLEEALDLLDQPDTVLAEKYEKLTKEKTVEHTTVTIGAHVEEQVTEPVKPVEEEEKISTPVEDNEEEPQEDDDELALPEKLSSNEKPQKESENLPLHVFLSRKVQESKKRKEQQLKKLQEEQERILLDFQPTRRQRKCAIGKQGLLAEISSSDEETFSKDVRRSSDKSDYEKPRKQKKESKEKRKERYIEKKHEQMIAKEQKAIEEEILRELEKKKEALSQTTTDIKSPSTTIEEKDLENKTSPPTQKKKGKEKQKKSGKEDPTTKEDEVTSDFETNCDKPIEPSLETPAQPESEEPAKPKKTKSPVKPKKGPKADAKPATGSRKHKNSNTDKSKGRASTVGKDSKERRSSSGRRDSDDEELKTGKSWNKVEEGVGVAIGRRKRAAANQLYYWSSSSDEEEMIEVAPTVEEEEDDRQEQHGWIVGDSHKRMITMLAMEKQLKEKRRRSEDEFDPGRAKSKKHRNSTS